MNSDQTPFASTLLKKYKNVLCRYKVLSVSDISMSDCTDALHKSLIGQTAYTIRQISVGDFLYVVRDSDGHTIRTSPVTSFVIFGDRDVILAKTHNSCYHLKILDRDRKVDDTQCTNG